MPIIIWKKGMRVNFSPYQGFRIVLGKSRTLFTIITIVRTIIVVIILSSVFSLKKAIQKELVDSNPTNLGYCRTNDDRNIT